MQVWVYDNGESWSSWCVYFVQAEITREEAEWLGETMDHELIGTGRDAEWFVGEPETLRDYCRDTGLDVQDEETLRVAIEKERMEKVEELKKEIGDLERCIRDDSGDSDWDLQLKGQLENELEDLIAKGLN